MSGSRLRQLMEQDPEQAFALLRALQAKQVVLHEAQQQVYDHPARFKIMNAGRRTGKTVLAAKIFVNRSRSRNQMLWWVAPTYKVVKRGYAEVLRQLPDGLLTKPAPPDTHFDAGRAVILHFKNGTKMEFYSAERPEGMLGEGVDFAILDEAAIMPGRIWNQVVSPTLMDRQGGALMISTPRGRNWFYKVYQAGQDPLKEDWASWTFTSHNNPTLPEGEVERMRAALPRMEFEQEVLAKFLAAGSSVFYLPEACAQLDRTIEAGWVEDVDPVGHIVLGIDLAKTSDYTVIYGARTFDRKNCYYERMQEVTWPEQKRRIKRAVRKLMRRDGVTGVTLVMDSTGVGDPIVDDLEEAGYDVIGLNFTTHKTNMVKLLAKDLEEGTAFILEDGRAEFENYQMRVSLAGRYTYSAPEGEHDDVVSAKMLQHHGLVNEGVPAATVLSPLDPIDVPARLDVADDELGDYDEAFIDADFELTEDQAMEAVGLPVRAPTVTDLMARAEVWF